MSNDINSKRQRRLESKKKKVEAFLQLVKDKPGYNIPESFVENKNGMSANSPNASAQHENDQSSQTISQNSDEAGQSTPGTDAFRQEYSAKVRASKKTIMEKPKFFLTPAGLAIRQPNVNTSFSLYPPELPEIEYSPVFVTDVQSLILFALQGNRCSFKPRWCKLLRVNKLKKTVLIVVDHLSATEWNKEKEEVGSLEFMVKTFPAHQEVVAPSYYASNVFKDLFSVPVSFRKLQRLCYENIDKSVSRFTLGDCEHALPTESKGDFRVDLVLNPEQMAEEGYPLPYTKKKFHGFVFTSDQYQPLTQNSPLFAMDCEMCMTKQGQEVTRVAMVNENLDVLMDVLVKPYNNITNYLTRYSGITRNMLKNVTTRLKDVQNQIRSILPPNAILCGQSLNGDLNALKMFHPYVIDTSIIYNLTGQRTFKPGLKRLSLHFLNKEIQNDPNGHNPVEDSTATMELVKLKLSCSMEFGDLTFAMNTVEGESGLTPSNSKSDLQSLNANGADNKKSRHESDSASDDSDDESCKASASQETESQKKRQLFFHGPGSNRTQNMLQLINGSGKTSLVISDNPEVEDVMKEFEESSQLNVTQVKVANDREASKICRDRVNDQDFTLVHMTSYNPDLPQERQQRQLRRLDKRIKKIFNTVEPNSVVVVLFGGRTEADTTHNAVSFAAITSSQDADKNQS